METRDFSANTERLSSHAINNADESAIYTKVLPDSSFISPGDSAMALKKKRQGKAFCYV